jgi:hypothetical protein
MKSISSVLCGLRSKVSSGSSFACLRKFWGVRIAPLEFPPHVGLDVPVDDGLQLRRLAQVSDQDVRRADEGMDRDLVAFVEIHLDRRINLSACRFQLRDDHRGRIVAPACGASSG